MSNIWETDSCTAMKAHYAIYSIPQAAALWCGVPDDRIDKILEEATQLSSSGLGRSVWTHSDINCLEPRSRAIAEAIEDGSLPYGREDGKTLEKGDYAAYERRRIFGRDLKAWMLKVFPNEKPHFLFDEIEQGVHTSISADSYTVLQADRDALNVRVENGIKKYKALEKEKNSIEIERDGLKAKLISLNVPNERSENTYQNIIAALLDCIAGNLPNVEKHPSFNSEAKLIEAIDIHFRGYSGLSKSNLSRKFPDAKKALKSQ